MKKMVTILFLFFLIFIATPSVKALDQEEEEIYDYCTLTEYNNLRKLASAVNVSFAYEKTELIPGYFTYIKVGKFSITVNNLGSNLYAVETKTNTVADSKKPKMQYFDSNKAYNINIYALNGCTNKPLLTHYINIPKYNPWSEEAVCKEIKEFYMCNKWYSIDLTQEEFEKGVEKYKEDLKNKKDPKPEEEQKTMNFFEQLINFFVNNYLYILGALAILTIGGVIAYIIRERRMRL